MKIVTIPNKSLRIKSKPVTKSDKKLHQFINDLQNTLVKKKDPEGVGLSAPQVGKNIRVFTTWIGEPKESRQIRNYINPTITKHSAKTTLGPDPKKPFLEGCLSIPNIFGAVPRHTWIEIQYLKLDPDTFQFIDQHERLTDFPARVVQHEIDHLDGILFTDRTLESNLPIFEQREDKLVEIDLAS